ncbi:MAG TPA: hypothetical protein VF516_13580 [Kofleriaceae bacterium]
MTFIACLLVTRLVCPRRRSARRRIDDRDAVFSASNLAQLRADHLELRARRRGDARHLAAGRDLYQIRFVVTFVAVGVRFRPDMSVLRTGPCRAAGQGTNPWLGSFAGLAATTATTATDDGGCNLDQLTGAGAAVELAAGASGAAMGHRWRPDRRALPDDEAAFVE